ncbi:hypothetical protein C8P63_10543 [Melghirimyces profundicolus]|uniref:Uncharacterized protein n=1 Tax=Melghirimyces profundicolus TaxID=1242148 RepID=A0A2T6C2C2_9BACL|nr:hypothetical protein [Melghirimyces profundicolus]PTX62448.1 hypothetical protein C8P63_10543 [Melghirimyces profundicolus]
MHDHDPYRGKTRVNRPVSFNPRDRTQRMMLEYIDREDVNFSGLVKNLLFTYLTGNLDLSGRSVEDSPVGRQERSKPEPRPASPASVKEPFGGMPVDF